MLFEKWFYQSMFKERGKIPFRKRKVYQMDNRLEKDRKEGFEEASRDDVKWGG
jgi:hypothetical protein